MLFCRHLKVADKRKTTYYPNGNQRSYRMYLRSPYELVFLPRDVTFHPGSNLILGQLLNHKRLVCIKADNDGSIRQNHTKQILAAWQ